MPNPVSTQVNPDRLEEYRTELTGYCYRMLGSAFEADDAVQDTMLRAWRAADSFEGRSSVRSWLYRIATNICLDMLRGRKHRALPMDLGPAGVPVESMLGAPGPEERWITPVADSSVLAMEADPAEVTLQRESIRLAFITVLQELPPRQRAALIMCEVLKMPAAEAAGALGTSVAAVNSALQRARATLAGSSADPGPALRGDAAAVDQDLLARYVDAFQRYDMAALLRTLHHDATMQMPPYSLWLRGSSDIVTWMLEPTPSQCRGSVLIPAGLANGRQAWGQYKPDPAGGYRPWSLQVHEVSGDRIGHLCFFLDTERVFPLFGLPPHLDAAPGR